MGAKSFSWRVSAREEGHAVYSSEVESIIWLVARSIKTCRKKVKLLSMLKSRELIL